MVTLAHSDDPVYEMYVWTYLADVQTSKPCEDMLLMNMRSELQELAEVNESLRKEVKQQHYKIREHNSNYARLLENNNDLISELLQIKLKKRQLQ